MFVLVVTVRVVEIVVMSRLANGPNGWIGVDFDRTLSYREHDGGDSLPGPPVAAMVSRVKRWLAAGKNVRIFTARVAPGLTEPGWIPPEEQKAVIEAWCLKHLGQVLPVTCQKDYYMLELWDDIAVSVEENTGRQLSPSKVENTPVNVVQNAPRFESLSRWLEAGFID